MYVRHILKCADSGREVHSSAKDPVEKRAPYSSGGVVGSVAKGGWLLEREEHRTPQVLGFIRVHGSVAGSMVQGRERERTVLLS